MVHASYDVGKQVIGIRDRSGRPSQKGTLIAHVRGKAWSRLIVMEVATHDQIWNMLVKVDLTGLFL